MPCKTIALCLSLVTATSATAADDTGRSAWPSGRDGSRMENASAWSTRLSFGLSATSNINDGRATAPVGLQELPFVYALQGSDRTLSARSLDIGVAATRALAQSDSSTTTLSLSAFQRVVFLTDKGSDRAPDDVDGSDFNLASLTAGLGQAWNLGDGRTVLGAEAALGQVFLGGDPLYANLNVGGSVSYALSPDMDLKFRAMREAQKGHDDRPDAHAWRGSLGLVTHLPEGHRLTTSYNYAEGSSSADYLDYADHEIALRLALAQPVLGASVDMGLSASRNHHARNPITSGDRDDDTVAADVMLTFGERDYNGLVPSVTLLARRTNSNIEVFETEEVGIQLGLNSRF